MYFLKLKYEVSKTFKVYKDIVDNTCGNNIKVLRTENGQEYVNKSL